MAQVQQQPGYTYSGQEMDQYKFEKEPHHKGWAKFDIKSVRIPSSAGLGMVKRYYQQRTLAQYAALWFGGMYLFNYASDPMWRAGGLGLLFPGAGFIAMGTIWGYLGFILSIVLLPVTLFTWFAMGGVVFPFFLWWGGAALAGYLSKGKELSARSGSVVGTLCVLFVTWMMWKTAGINKAAAARARARNKWLPTEVEKQVAESTPAPPAGEREIDVNTLRHVQYMVERGLSKHDDFSYHDVIDQFQTGAVRYQLYGIVDSLAIMTALYTPNFHGYVAEACRNSIEKSLSKKIMSFWKWERLTGKLTTDYDPIKQDNIMVTGYLGVAIGLYASATGDTRYNEKGSLVFQLSDDLEFPRSFGDLADAMYQNMSTNDYCLYPCEPNWTYSLCNLIGMAGLIVSSRVLGNDYADKIKPRFERALEDEMTEPDGRILPIRSELTGLTIPGLSGILTDCINAMNLTAYLPHIGSRVWAILRHEYIYHDENGRMDIHDLQGADKMDPGNYKGGVGALRAYIAGAAAEYGDEEIRKEALDQLDNQFHPVEATKTGAFVNKGLSATTQTTALLARLGRRADLANCTLYGPDPTAMKGPILQECKFPEVLVAKAYSHDGKGMDLVLHNGKATGKQRLGFERLQPNTNYTLGRDSFTSDASGKGKVDVMLDGRTQLTLSPA